MNQVPTAEERIWAVLTHLSALGIGMGLILPVIGWAEQRGKSKYAVFQSLQALGYQSLGYTVWTLVGLLVGGASIFFLLFNIESVHDSEAALNGWLIGHFSLVFVIASLYFAPPVIAAIACALGNDFYYPFMGKRLAKYLNYDSVNEDSLNEDREDRWVAAAGHFSVIIAFWGLFAPVAAWILQGRRSAWLKFQSAQAIALHTFTLLFGFAAGALYLVGFVAFIGLTGFSGESMNSSAGLIGIIVAFGAMAAALLMFLVIPLFHVMGQWAGYRTLKGDDYRYPIIGKLVARVILKQETL